MDFPAVGFCFVKLVIILLHNLPCTLSNPALLSCDSVFECGDVKAKFPFWGENRGETSLNISNILFNVIHIDNTFKTLKLVRQDYSLSFCSVKSFTKTNFPTKLFEQSPDYKNLTVFSNCDSHFRYLENFTCSKGGTGSVYHSENYYRLSKVIVPAGFVPEKEAWNFENVLREGFDVKLKINEKPCQKCVKTGGFCSFDKSATQFCCKEDFSFYPNRLKELSGALLGIKCLKTTR